MTIKWSQATEDLPSELKLWEKIAHKEKRFCIASCIMYVTN